MDFIILVAIKLTIGFIALVLFMNLNGRSQLAPTSTEDQIGNYVLGGIIGGVIYSPNISIIQFLIVLLIWGLLMTVTDFLKNTNKSVKKMIDGQVVYLIRDGKMLTENFAQATLSIPDFYTKLRTKGVTQISDIEEAFMESNGQLIVIKKGEDGYSNLLVSEGNIQEDNLKHIGKDDNWLKEELEKYNITDLSELFIVEYSGDGKLFRLLKPERFGIRLTEEHMMYPEATVSAIVFSQPFCKYFNM